MKTVNNKPQNIRIAALLATAMTGCDGQDEKTPEEIAAPPTMAATKPVVPPAAPATVTPQPAPLSPVPQPVPTAPEPVPYHATLEEGVDFGRDSWPDFIQEVSGVTQIFAPDLDGRWSDANRSPAIRLVFKNNLPKKFTLIIDGIAYATNAHKAGKVITGGVVKPIIFNKEILVGKIPGTEVVKVDIQSKTPSNTIEIAPPNPVTAKEVGGGGNTSMRLGYFIRSVKIIPEQN